MKKVILITAITIVALSQSAKSQTVVSACGTNVKLSADQISYLHRFKDTKINTAIESCRSIKYNSTADIIIQILRQRKVSPKYLAVTKSAKN